MPDPLLTITLPGPPVGKGRPRFRIVKPRGRPQFVTVYTDSQTAKYEESLAAIARMEMSGCMALDEPLSVAVEAAVAVPDSWSASKRAAALAFDIMPTSTPDCDNYLKIALDALNKIAWRDDSLVVQTSCQKFYSAAPHLRVAIYRWND